MHELYFVCQENMSKELTKMKQPQKMYCKRHGERTKRYKISFEILLKNYFFSNRDVN